MNRIRLKIGNETYTGKMSVPLTVQTTLNDTLDSAQFVLPYLQKREPFEPMTDVELQIGESEAVIWLLADDQVQEIMGTGRFTHTVTLVEYTKIAERILMEAKSFTNPLKANYQLDADKVVAKIYNNKEKYQEIEIPLDIISSIMIGDFPMIVDLPSAKEAFGKYFPFNPSAIPVKKIYLYGSNYMPDIDTYISSGDDPGDLKASTDLEFSDDESVRVRVDQPGEYTVRYYYHYLEEADGSLPIINNFSSYIQFSVYEKVPQRDPYTIQKVIDILLQVSSPLRTEDVCEWALFDDQKMLPCMMQKSPEFSFADSRSLWENLREIGRVIHAIPRVIKKDDKGADKKVRFDFLGGSAQADFSNGKRISRISASDISNYTAGLETMAANLISAENESSGSIVEPYDGGYKSLRTATETARIQEGTSFIETSLPIEKIIKVKAHFEVDSNQFTCDITPYVLEKADYDILSTVSGAFPTSRCFAIFFTRGSKNIDGLWFKPSDSASNLFGALKNYSIVNILAKLSKIKPSFFNEMTYPEISFRVEYIPTVTARIHHYRPDARRGAGLLANNQAANKLSAYALGENMRGQLAMLSTSTRSELWLFPKYEDIPKAGELVDDSMYISSVTARVYPGYCEAQIELSENYNEQGAFVEMPSKFRQYEIPAGNERHTVIDEFCYISDSPSSDNWTLADKELKRLIGDGISINAIPNKITLAIATTYEEGGKVLADNLRFPVMGLAIGNSLYFGFSMRDNYAVGNKSISGGKQYRMNQAVRYGDQYYATAYLIGFKLVTNAHPVYSNSIADANAFPDTDASSLFNGYAAVSTGANPLIWHKDSADAGNIAYQLHFLSDSGYIIGSSLAAFCAAVRNTKAPNDIQLYFFSTRLHPINGISEVEKAIGQGAPIPVIDYGFCDNDGHEDSENGNCLYISTNVINDIPAGTKSWAIIRDGKFILGRNESTPPKKIYFNIKRRLQK